MTDLLVVVHNISQMVTATVMGLPHAHGVMSEIDIAVVAEEFRHFRDLQVNLEVVYMITLERLFG